MSHEYKSIESIFVRDPITHGLELGKIRVEAAETINAWSITEKVDGMNIRAIFSHEWGGGLRLTIRGRTDAANLPPGVAEAVERAFPIEGREFLANLWAKEFAANKTVTFYGEAIGEKIQGNPLRLAGKRFRVFDIIVGDKVWMDDATVQTLASDIGYAAVPLLGIINRIPQDETEMLQITRGGLSQIATERIMPEGIVARPLVPLFDTYGNRVIWKLTFREFKKLDEIARSKEVYDAAEVEGPAPLVI